MNFFSFAPRSKGRRDLIKPAVFLVSVLLLWGGWSVTSYSPPDGGSDIPAAKAKVVGIQSRVTSPLDLGGEAMEETVITFFARILSGPHKGKLVFSQQSSDPFYPIALKEIAVGDKVMLHLVDNGTGTAAWQLGEFVRTDGLLWLAGVYVLLLLLLGKQKGLWVILSLALTCASIFFVFIPAILGGQNAYLWSSAVCLFTILSTLLLVSGANRKTLAAVVGCTAGVATAGLLTLLMSRLLLLSGFVDENSAYLATMGRGGIDLNAILFAGIVIGALGAVMDVSMSIASALWEIASQECTTPANLWKSGIAIGRDVMGTMANTLVLAYIGNSLSIVLLLIAYSTSTLGLLNREMIVVEILFALVGSIGIVCAIPLTSAVCSAIYSQGGSTEEVTLP